MDNYVKYLENKIRGSIFIKTVEIYLLIKKRSKSKEEWAKIKKKDKSREKNFAAV